MPVANITDSADPRVADYLCLTDVDLRTKVEPPRGLFIAEGELVIRRAVRAGYRLRSVLLSPAWLRSVPALDLPPDTQVYVAGAEVLEAITGFRVHRGALASVHRRPLPTAAALLGAARMLSESGDSAETLRAAVTSPGGTTAAGLRALEAAAVRSAFLDAVVAATERSRELGG